jgi:hypothetical protein
MDITQIQVDNGFLYILSGDGAIFRKDLKISGAQWESITLPDIEEVVARELEEANKLKNG